MQKLVEIACYLHVCETCSTELKEASRKSWIDYEDCLIAVCAESIAADVIISRNRNGFSKAKTPTFSIEEFFDWIENEYGIVYESADFY